MAHSDHCKKAFNCPCTWLLVLCMLMLLLEGCPKPQPGNLNPQPACHPLLNNLCCAVSETAAEAGKNY